MVSSKKPTAQQPSYEGKNAAIYIRVSTDKQEEGYSKEFQEEQAIAWIKDQMCVFDRDKHIWSDTHTGMEIFERPGLTALRHAAKRGEIDVVVMYKLDRFSRIGWQQEMVREELKQHGVTVVTIKKDEHSDDDSPLGAVIRAFYSFKAEEERNDIIMRTQDGIKTKVNKGHLLGAGKPAFGYVWNASGKDRTHYVINPDEAAIVHRIFKMFVEGATLRTIAMTLTKEGVPTPTRRNHLWKISTLKVILTNESYTGKATFFKESYVKVPGQKSKQRVSRPNHERVYLPDGLIPPLIDQETFERAQKRLVQNKQLAARNSKDPKVALLRCGLIRCGHCGYSLMATHISQKNVYRCYRRTRGEGDCEAGVISVRKVDTAAWEHAVAIIRNPMLVTQAVEKKRQSDPTKDNRRALKKKLEDIALEIENCTQMIREAKTPKIRAIFSDELERLLKDQEGIEKTLRQVSEQQDIWAKEQERLDNFVKWCDKKRELLDDPTHEITYEEKREALERLGIEARVWRRQGKPYFEITSTPPEFVSSMVWNNAMPVCAVWEPTMLISISATAMMQTRPSKRCCAH